MTARGPYGMTTQLTFNTDISLRLMNYAVSHGLDTREAVSKILGEALPPLSVVPRPAPVTQLPPVTQVQAQPIAPVVAVPNILSPITEDFAGVTAALGAHTVVNKALIRALMQREGVYFHFKNLFTEESWDSLRPSIRTLSQAMFRRRVGDYGYPKSEPSQTGGKKKYIHKVTEDESGRRTLRNATLYRVRYE